MAFGLWRLFAPWGERDLLPTVPGAASLGLSYMLAAGCGAEKDETPPLQDEMPPALERGQDKADEDAESEPEEQLAPEAKPVKVMPCRATTRALSPRAGIDGNYVVFDYDSQGRVRRSENKAANGRAIDAYAWEYGPAGARVTWHRGAQAIPIKFALKNGMYLQGEPEDASMVRHLPVTEYEFDEKGGLVKSTDAGGRETCTYEYEVDGARPFPRYSFGESRRYCERPGNDARMDFEYDDSGRVLSINLTEVRTYGPDCSRGFDRCVTPPPREAPQWVLTFEYDC